MAKSILINIIKFVFAGSLIYWLVSSGKLDMSLVKDSLSKPLNIFLIIFLLLFDHGIAAFRWRIILHEKTDHPIKFFKVFTSNWIGIFFNSVLPGAVTGDLIKLFYIKKESSQFSNKFLLGSVFLDRLIGLFGLVVVGGVSCLIFYNFLTSISENAKSLVHSNLFLLAGVVFSFLFVFFLKDLPLLISKKLKVIKPLISILEKLENIWNQLCELKHKLLILLLLSIIIQAVAVYIFWFIVSPYSTQLFELKQAFTIFPIGMISISIPISPAGLGVGHFVYGKLFSFYGIENGVNLFNLYFCYVIMVNLTGAIPYLFFRKKQNS